MVDIGKKINLFNDRLILETIRQWVELIVGIVFIYWFTLCAFRLKKTLKSWLVLDVVLLLILDLRVFLFLSFEFILPSRCLIFIADNLYLGIVILIFYMFAKVVFPVNVHKIFNKTTYIMVMIFLLLAQMIYALIDFEEAFHCKDAKVDSGTEIHNIILQTVEICIGFGNLILAFSVSKMHSKKVDEQDEKEYQLREMLNQTEDLKEIKKKLLIIGIGGFVCSIFRASRAILSHAFIKNNSNYVCEQDMYYIALNNATELFVWYKFIVSFIPTFLLFYVIYYIPNRSGKITQMRNGNQKVKINEIDINKAMQDMENEEKNNTNSSGFLFDKSRIKSKDMFSPNSSQNHNINITSEDTNRDGSMAINDEPSFNSYMKDSYEKGAKKSPKKSRRQQNYQYNEQSTIINGEVDRDTALN